MTLKALFLAILFDDTRYVVFSELEIERRYADLCLLVREQMRRYGLFDLLLELKLVRRSELGKTGEQLRALSEEELRALPPVNAALSEARTQAAAYRDALIARFGPETLKLRCFAVVAVGFERMLGEEVTEGHTQRNLEK
jgi:hypothetical protein